MSRRRVGRGGYSRGPKNNIWSVIQIEQATLDGTVVDADIVQSSEWQGSGTSFQRATLLRIRGWLSVTQTAVDTDAGTAVFAIYVVDANAAAISPRNTSLYTDEDVLWTWGTQFGGRGVGAVETAQAFNATIDVKSMRKLNTAMDVRLAMIATSAAPCLVSGVVRGLIRKGGN